jgi:hypothetical protein
VDSSVPGYGLVVGSCEHDTKPSVLKIHCGYSDYLSEQRFLKKHSAS